jgi:hypothetical protein
MGRLSLRGYTQKIEPFLWLFAGMATAVVVSNGAGIKIFLRELSIDFSGPAE